MHRNLSLAFIFTSDEQANSLPAAVRVDAASLYRQHSRRVARWIAKLGGPHIDVDDATQEVFLLAHRERASFRGDARVTTWLYRIAMNVVRHHQRRHYRQEWLSGSADDVAGHLASPAPTPVDELEKQRWRARLERALAGLSERDRSILVMFEIDELSGQEIAERTAVKLATLWVQLHRARAQLLRALQA